MLQLSMEEAAELGRVVHPEELEGRLPPLDERASNQTPLARSDARRSFAIGCA
jgi:hypothetical protein